MSTKLDEALDKETAFHSRLGLGNTQFKTSLQFGKQKLSGRLLGDDHGYDAVLLYSGNPQPRKAVWLV